MEKKVFTIDAYFILTFVKKNEPTLFLVKNDKGELDFYKKSFELEGIGFHEEKAKDMLRDHLINFILGKKAYVENQKLLFEPAGKRIYKCKYFINLSDNKVFVKNGEFYSMYNAMDIRNKMSDMVRTFLVNYVEQKKTIFDEQSK
jgi:hypothetical protein